MLGGGALKSLYRHPASSIAVYPRRSESQSLRWYTGIELAFFQHLPKHPLPILSSGAEAVGGVPEPAVLYTRPCGVPSVGREPEKRRFAPLSRRALATASSAAPPTPVREAIQ